MDTNQFKKLLNFNFVPSLRKIGFRGSGFSFRKVTNKHYIYAITIQANKYGGSCCMELGVYIDFVPNPLGNVIPPTKVTTKDCEFRKRIRPIDKGFDYWWEFGENEQVALNSIIDMLETFEKIGIPFFDQFENFPSPLGAIKIEDIKNNSSKLTQLGAPLDLRLALILARIHKFSGNIVEAMKFCDWGLNNIDNAISLIPIFEGIKSEMTYRI